MERGRERFIIRNWLVQLQRLTNPQLCSQQSGDPGQANRVSSSLSPKAGDWCHSWKTVRLEKFPLTRPFMLVSLSTVWVRPTPTAEFSLIQMLITSRNALTDTLRILLDQRAGRPVAQPRWHIKWAVTGSQPTIHPWTRCGLWVAGISILCLWPWQGGKAAHHSHGWSLPLTWCQHLQWQARPHPWGSQAQPTAGLPGTLHSRPCSPSGDTHYLGSSEQWSHQIKSPSFHGIWELRPRRSPSQLFMRPEPSLYQTSSSQAGPEDRRSQSKRTSLQIQLRHHSVLYCFPVFKFILTGIRSWDGCFVF